MWPFRKPARPDFSLLKGARAYGPVKWLSTPRARVDYDAIQWPLGRSGVTRGYQPASTAPEQNPPQSVSGIISSREKEIILAMWHTRHLYGYTLQDIVERLNREPESVGKSSDGIEPCGYEEL